MDEKEATEVSDVIQQPSLYLLLNGSGEIYTIEQVAGALNVSTGTVRNWISSNQLRSLRFGSTTRIERNYLIEFINKAAQGYSWQWDEVRRHFIPVTDEEIESFLEEQRTYEFNRIDS